MNKLLLTLFITLMSFGVTKAQFDLSNFYGGVKVGFAKPIGKFSEFAKGGLSYNVEAGYKINENIGVGFEYARAVTAAIDTSASAGLININIFGLNSYFLKGWYTIPMGSFKPYAAVGLGVTRFKEPDFTINGNTTYGDTRYGAGGDIELGFVVKGFNLAYNFVYNGKSVKEPVYNDNVKNLSVAFHRFSIGYLYGF